MTTRVRYALAAAVAVVVPLAVGGYALAAGTLRDVTFSGCLAGGKLAQVRVTATPSCAATATPVQWAGQAAVASPSPSPTATTPSPSPSPSPTGTGAACVTSGPSGGCGPYNYPPITASNGYNTYVVNNVWNAIPGWQQTLTANSPGDWSVVADMPAGNTAVVSYPDTQQLYTTTSNTPAPLTGFTSITSTFAEAGPGAGAGNDYEAAFDIWAGTGSSNGTQEIMIWTDNHGQIPAGHQTGTVTIGSDTYQVWSTGGSGQVGNPVSLVLDHNETTGTVDLLADLNWLVANGYMPAGSGLNQIDYGFEICSTGGAAETFTVSSYDLKSG